MLVTAFAVALIHQSPVEATPPPKPEQHFLGVLAVVYSEARGSLGPLIRVAFTRKDGQWVSLARTSTSENLDDSMTRFRGLMPPKLSWNVCFDGKQRGSLSTTLPNTWRSYSLVGTSRLDANQKIPWSGKKSGSRSSSARRAREPLVVNTENSCEDPEGWKPSKPTWAALVPLIGRFKAVVRQADPAFRPIASSAIKVSSSYRSEKGEQLVSLRTTLNRDDIVGEIFNWSSQTYLVDAEGIITHVGNELSLIDAGDYDNDGQSEFVFKLQGYNQEGFVLVWDHGKKSARFEWSNH